VEALLENGEVVKFGKEEERIKPPKMEGGLLNYTSDASISMADLGL